MSEYLSSFDACAIADDLKENPEHLEPHLETLMGLNVTAETLLESSLEHVLGRFAYDEEHGEVVRALIMEYCQVSSVAQIEHKQQMERLRQVRDSLYPERPLRDVDLIFKKRKWTPLPYDMDDNTLTRLADQIPRAVVAPPAAKATKRKAVQDENENPAKFPRVEIEERPMEAKDGGPEKKRIILRIRFRQG